MKDKYDVIVIGGGTAGAVMAKFLAQRGIDVALFEKKKFEEQHKICGDAVSKYHFDEVSRIDPDNSVDYPRGSELCNTIKGLILLSPTLKQFRIPSDKTSWILDRASFGQRLLREAREAGAELWDNIIVDHPILNSNEDKVIGLNINNGNGFEKDIKTRIVVDASGMAGVVRKHIDGEKANWDAMIKHTDEAATYREIVKFDTSIENPDYLRFYFNPEICPGGYFWLFPRDSTFANVGLGITPRSVDGGPKAVYQNCKTWEPSLFNGNHTVIHKGGAIIPLRRPMDSLVYGGVVLLGDAGACVRATDGAGIGFTMTCASHAASPIEKALQHDNVEQDGPLWQYNVNFMRDQGAQLGPLMLLKQWMVEGTNNDFSILLDNGVISPGDLFKLSNGIPVNLGFRQQVSRLWNGISILPYLLKLVKTINRMKKVRELYLSYPENIEDFPVWRSQIVTLFKEDK